MSNICCKAIMAGDVAPLMERGWGEVLPEFQYNGQFSC